MNYCVGEYRHQHQAGDNAIADNAGCSAVGRVDVNNTSGLLNANTWGILGYDPAYAQILMKNLVLWTLDGQKDD